MGAIAQVNLIEIRHPNLPGGVWRFQKYSLGVYNWQGLDYQFQGFDLEGAGAVFRSCGVGLDAYRLIVPLRDKRLSPKKYLTDSIVAAGLLGATVRLIQIFPGVPGGEQQPQQARLLLNSLVIKGGHAIWALSGPDTAFQRSVRGIHPNRQFAATS
jgi:hypothetical protein